MHSISYLCIKDGYVHLRKTKYALVQAFTYPPMYMIKIVFLFRTYFLCTKKRKHTYELFFHIELAIRHYVHDRVIFTFLPHVWQHTVM